jgi:hypothetical protein
VAGGKLAFGRPSPLGRPAETPQDRIPVSVSQSLTADNHVPEYLPSIPEDPFSEGPLGLRVASEAFVTYSVGRDGDDGGEIPIVHEPKEVAPGVTVIPIADPPI